MDKKWLWKTFGCLAGLILIITAVYCLPALHLYAGPLSEETGLSSEEIVDYYSYNASVPYVHGVDSFLFHYEGKRVLRDEAFVPRQDFSMIGSYFPLGSTVQESFIWSNFMFIVIGIIASFLVFSYYLKSLGLSFAAVLLAYINPFMLPRNNIFVIDTDLLIIACFMSLFFAAVYTCVLSKRIHKLKFWQWLVAISPIFVIYVIATKALLRYWQGGWFFVLVALVILLYQVIYYFFRKNEIAFPLLCLFLVSAFYYFRVGQLDVIGYANMLFSLHAVVGINSIYPNIMASIAELGDGGLTGVLRVIPFIFIPIGFFSFFSSSQLYSSHNKGKGKKFIMLGMMFVVTLIMLKNFMLGVGILAIFVAYKMLKKSRYDRASSVGVFRKLWFKVPKPEYFMIVFYFFITLMSLRSGVRFAEFFIFPFSILLVHGIVKVSSIFFAKYVDEDMTKKSFMYIAMSIFLFALLFGPMMSKAVLQTAYTRPVLNDPYFDILTDLQQDCIFRGRECTIASWWDDGYLMQDVTGIKAVVDNGNQRRSHTYWMARLLTSNDEAEIKGLLYNLASSSPVYPITESELIVFNDMLPTITTTPEREVYVVIQPQTINVFGWIDYFGTWNYTDPAAHNFEDIFAYDMSKDENFVSNLYYGEGYEFMELVSTRNDFNGNPYTVWRFDVKS